MLFLLSFHRNRVHQRTRLATVAASRAGSGRVLHYCCTRRGAAAVVDSMPRDTASRGWSPGDPVLFDGYNNGNHGAATSRKPLAAKKHAKQKDDGASTKPALPLQRQSTLSPWAKAAWKPGMRVVIAAPNNSSKQSTSSSTAPVEEAEEHRIKAHRSLLKGKQRLLEDNNKENFYEAERCALCWSHRLGALPDVCIQISFTSNIQRSSTHQMSEHIPFQTSNIYEDPSPR